MSGLYLIIKKKDRRFFCIKSVNGIYYIQIAEILTHDDDQLARSLTESKAPNDRVIIYEDEHRWMVTLPGDQNGDKLPWVRCANLTHAQKMKELGDAK